MVRSKATPHQFCYVDRFAPPQAPPPDIKPENGIHAINLLRSEEEARKEFEWITENVYVNRSKNKANLDEYPVCDCYANNCKCEDETCLNRALLIECCYRLCPCKHDCQNRRMQLRNWQKVEMVHDKRKGWGLITKNDIPKNELVVEYVGEVINEEEYKRRAAIYHDHHQYFMSLDNNEYIDASRKANIGRFINHSCDPNCRIEKWTVLGEQRVGIFADKDIKKGTELSFDYSFVQYGKNPQRCYCGSENCRHYIGKRCEGKRRRTVDKVPTLFNCKTCLDEEFNYDPVTKEIVPLIQRPKYCKDITTKIMKYLNSGWNKNHRYYNRKKQYKLYLNRNIRKVRFSFTYTKALLSDILVNIYFEKYKKENVSSESD